MGNEEWKATRPAVVTPTSKGIANVWSVEPKCHGKRHDQRGQPRNLSRQSPKLRRRRDKGRRGQPPKGTGSHCLGP